MENLKLDIINNLKNIIGFCSLTNIDLSEAFAKKVNENKWNELILIETNEKQVSIKFALIVMDSIRLDFIMKSIKASIKNILSSYSLTIKTLDIYVRGVSCDKK
ncbi:hypothetical protein [Mycoplasmopsis pulmonis]|nr:hypothetical protein [Mycoplasmopsis pulmonis]MDZ7293128.1 hypothetical protein [Mycoplasmopsis pulmonis]